MKNSSLLICLLFCSYVHAQNLVTNPSLETYTACPNNIGQIGNATGWFRMPFHGGTPEYLNVCSTVANVDLPTNAFGSEQARTGNGCGGVVLYYGAAPEFREYTQNQLLSPMIAGQNYFIQIYASLGENSQYSSPSFQFYFSATQPSCNCGWGPANTVVPQVNSATHVTSKTGWTLVTASYTAVGGEQWVTFGNFRNDASTPLTFQGAATYSSVYYYFDDFSITPFSPLPIELLEFSATCTDEGDRIAWSTATELNSDYFTVLATTDGIHYDSISGIEAAGNSSEVLNYQCVFPRFTDSVRYYTLTETDLDGRRETIKTVSAQCDVQDSDLCGSVHVFEGTIYLKNTNAGDAPVLFSIFSVTGQLIESFELENGSAARILSPCPPGWYIVLIRSEGEACAQKFYRE